jgi:hypothetical protein
MTLYAVNIGTFNKFHKKYEFTIKICVDYNKIIFVCDTKNGKSLSFKFSDKYFTENHLELIENVNL